MHDLLTLERKIWHAIFGDKDSPEGYEIVEHPLIPEGRAYRKETPEGNYYFDVPVIVDKEGIKEDIRLYRYLQQNRKKNSQWGKLAERGFRIMWCIDLENNTFLYRYSNLKLKNGKLEGKVNLKEEKIRQLIANAKAINFSTILR